MRDTMCLWLRCGMRKGGCLCNKSEAEREVFLTTAAVVIHQDDLFEQVWCCLLDGRVDRAQQD